MSPRCRGLCAFVLLISIAPVASQSGSGSPYQVVDLGGFAPEAINGSGQIAGVAVKPSGQLAAFRWQNGMLEELAIPSRPVNGWIRVSGINESGHIAGAVDAEGLGTRGYLWANGTTTLLDTLGGSFSQAYALNSLDQVVGFAAVPNDEMRAVLWNGSTPVNLGTLGGQSWANGVNNLGQVVGESYTSSTESHAFLYDNGVMIDLGTLGGSHSAGYAINEEGLVLGWSLLPGDTVAHPFLWQNGTMTDLGVLPGTTGTTELVNSINRHGDMIGYSELVSGEPELHAVLYRNGAFIDLNTQLPPDSGWSLRLAQRINDAGQIVGHGLLNNEHRNFLLIPVGATTTGEDVVVSPTVELPGGSTATMSLQFESVTQGGETAVTASESGPVVPAGFQLPDEPVFFDVQTTATFAGPVTLCFSWAEGALENEVSARLLHHEDGQWLDVTTSVDTQANVVCGVVTSLSPFAIVEFRYEFGGFEPPLLADGSGSILQTKTGRTIPVKFSLTFGGQPADDARATIAVYKLLDVASGTVDTTDLTSDAGAANENGVVFRNVGLGRYIYNLKTKGWSAPATYRVFASLDDGSVHFVDFSLR